MYIVLESEATWEDNQNDWISPAILGLEEICYR